MTIQNESTAVLVCYVLYLVIRAVVPNCRKKGTGAVGVTRKLNPKFGWFGFFGFFYEAKMNCTLMDERFKEEQSRAQLVSYRTGFGLLWAVAWFTGVMGGHIEIRYVALIFTAASSLIIALVFFLNSYLLYKYDTEEAE